MMSIKVVSGQQAGNYYSKDDYYSKEQGQWQGKSAEALGLRGPVIKEDFQQIMKGQDREGNQLVHSNNGKTLRGGADLTFSPGKGFSVTLLVGGDQRLLELHDRAATKALNFVEESLIQVRVTENGVTQRVNTGNLVVAKFTHETSRLMDPQLHVHAVVANCSQAQSGEWKAISNENLYTHRVLISQIYRNELAAGLKELGYGIQIGRNGLVDIKLPQELTQAYSQRREEILQALNGREGTALAEKITLMTRQAKPHQIDREALKQEWLDRAHQLGYTPEKIREMALHAGREIGKELLPKEHLQQTIISLQTQNITWSKEEILKITLQNGLIDGLRIDQVEKEIQKALEKGGLVQIAENRFSSLEAIRTEQKIIDLAQSRQGLFFSGDSRRIDQVIKEFGPHLNQGQREAIRLITGSSDGVVAVQGYAGVGKTSMLSVANQYWEKEGVLVQGLSFTGKAAEGLQAEAGINSRTLHSFLAEKENSIGVQKGRSQVWVIDEASMIGNRQMLEVLSVAARENARVALLGDIRQLQAIDAGKPFQVLQEKNTIPTAKMEEILRQKTEGLKNAVQAIAIEGDSNKAIQILDKMDGIKQIEDQKERLMTIARDYLALSPKEMRHTLIVTARNAERLQINLHIRDGLKEKGLINAASEKTYTMAIPQSIRDEDRRRGESYNQGDLVRFGRASQGLEVARGERGIIKEIDNNKLTVQMEKSHKTVIVDLGKYNKLERYSLESRQFAPGDQVTFLKNDRNLGVVNSSVGTVKELNNDNILKVETRTGIKEVDLAKYNYIDHSYGSTFHKSQGITSERVMIHIDTGQKMSNSANSFYVGLSRASHEATIYTNSREKLPESVSQWQVKESVQDFEKAKHLRFENETDRGEGNRKELDHSIQRGLGL